MRSTRPIAEQRLTSLIYDAALDLSLWDELLHAVRTFVPGDSIHFVCRDSQSADQAFLVQDNCNPTVVREYHQHYFRKDPNALVKERLPIGTVTVSNALMPDAEWERLEFYNDCTRRAGVFYQAGAFITKHSRFTARIGVCRSKSHGPFSGTDIQRLERLVPHLRRGFEIMRRLGIANLRVKTLASALEHAPVGVFLLDGQGRCVFTNGAARRMAQAGDGLALSANGLDCADPFAAKALKRTVGLVLAARRGQNPPPSQTVLVPRPSGFLPYQVLIAPLHEPTADWANLERFAAALVLVADPMDSVGRDSVHLLRTYGLTPAEMAVARRLAHGESPREIAERSERSVATVRTQIRTIYDKLGVHRQAELVRKLLAVTGPAASSSSARSPIQDLAGD